MSQIDLKAAFADLVSSLKANPLLHDVEIVKFSHTEGQEMREPDTVKFTYCERPYYLHVGQNGMQVTRPHESGDGLPVGKLIPVPWDFSKLVTDMIDSTIKE